MLAAFTEEQHLRGRDGKFISMGARVDVLNGEGKPRRGTVTAFTEWGPRITYDDGGYEIVSRGEASSWISAAPPTKAQLRNADVGPSSGDALRDSITGEDDSAAVTAIQSTLAAISTGDTQYALRKTTRSPGGALRTRIDILQGDTVVGRAKRLFSVDAQGDLVVEHELLELEPASQGQGIGAKLNRAMEQMYREQGVSAITLEANLDVGGYAWARAGYDFDWEYRDLGTGQTQGADIVHYLLDRIQAKGGDVAQLRAQLAGPQEQWPTPFDLSQVGWTAGAASWPGKDGLLGSIWNGRRKLG